MTSWGFMFAAEPDDRVGAGEVRFNAPPPYVGAVTYLYLANLTADGLNVKRPVLAYPTGTLVYIQHRADDTVYATVRMTAPPVECKGYVGIPVSCVAASPDGLTAGPVEVFFMPAGGVVMAAAAVGDPPLVTLDAAKQHLRITDPLHDADVTEKLTSASGAIRDYLGSSDDPTWTPATVPPWISAAVLLLLAHLYEHRGDEFGPSADNDDRVWNAIANLCRRSRTPALA
jgi:hypothetical protein